MNQHDHCRFVVYALPFFLASALGANATAQVPRGWSAVSSFNNGNSGGVSLVHPTMPGPAVPVTGLGADLQGTQTYAGAGSILIDEATGDLVVGEHAPPFSSIDVHVISLAGAALVSDLAYSVGVGGSNGGSVDQMAWRGRDILICNRGGPNATASGPLAGHHLGLVRPHIGPPGTPGTVVPLPIANPPLGGTNAVALDPQGANAYLGKYVFLGGNSYVSNIYQIPLAGPGPYTATLVATIPDAILQLGFDLQGRLLAGVGYVNGPPNVLHVIDLSVTPATVSPVLVPTVGDINGLAVEGATGCLLIGDSGAQTVLRMPANLGPPSPLSIIAGGLTGIAIRPSLATFGTATPGANSYTWQVAPNPGGLPGLGNTGFSLTIAASPGSAPGLLALSLGKQQQPTGLLLLDPATLVVHSLFAFSAQNSASMPLPVPNSQWLAGIDIYAQTAHFEAGGLATSNGLWLTLF